MRRMQSRLLPELLMTAPKGIYNITGEGVVFLSKAIRMLGKAGVPMLYPVARVASSVLRRVGTVDFPPDQLKFLIYGRVVDGKRAREEFGFVSRYTTEEAIADFRDNRSGTLESSTRPSWVRGLIGLRQSEAKEYV